MSQSATKAPHHNDDCELPQSERPAAEFAARRLALDELAHEVAYFLEHLPETRALQPAGKALAARLRKQFSVTLASAYVVEPVLLKRGKYKSRRIDDFAPDGKPY